MSLPSITIITPCLDAAATIEETLASVRAQEYDSELEHIVVDGGSTDGTLAILERAEGISFSSGPDSGRPEAANKGVARASGEVIGFLNADDRYEPGAVLAVGKAFAAHPEAEWATGYCRIIDAAGEEIRRPVTAYKNAFLRRFSFRLYLTQNFVSDPATFVRREALAAVGALQERYVISHDYDLWLRLARRGDPLLLRRYLASFRMAEGSLSMAGFERQFREHAEVARRRGEGHRAAVAVNAIVSRLIVLVYRLLRCLRRTPAS